MRDPIRLELGRRGCLLFRLTGISYFWRIAGLGRLFFSVGFGRGHVRLFRGISLVRLVVRPVTCRSRRATIGDVPAGTLEYHAYRLNHAPNTAVARWAGGQRLIGKFLILIELVPTVRAPITVRWHCSVNLDLHVALNGCMRRILRRFGPRLNVTERKYSAPDSS